MKTDKTITMTADAPEVRPVALKGRSRAASMFCYSD